MTTMSLISRGLYVQLGLPQNRHGISRLLTLTVLVACALIFTFLLYTASAQSSGTTLWTSLRGISLLSGLNDLQCSSEDYSSGHWAYSSNSHHNSSPSPAIMSSYDDVFAFNGFRGCASSREFWFHLGADDVERWGRFPGVTDWKWVPGETCKGLKELDGERLVRDLAERGGWFLVGGMFLPCSAGHSIACEFVDVTFDAVMDRFSHRKPLLLPIMYNVPPRPRYSHLHCCRL